MRGVIAILWFLASSACMADVSDSIVRIGAASGVCVDPCGLVMTARHIDLPEVVIVRFRDQNVTATRVYQCPEPDGPEVFDCVGDGYPFVRIASIVPPSGGLVSSGGFPMQSSEVKWASGKMLRESRFIYDGRQLHATPSGSVRANLVGFVTAPGWSGGPLFNDRGELCGINLASNRHGSLFATHASVRAAYSAAKSIVSEVMADSEKELPTLAVRCREQCPPCKQFKTDWETDAAFRRALSSCYSVDIATVPVDHPSVLTDSFPTFRVVGRAAIVGYRGKEKLLAELAGTPKPAVKVSSAAIVPPPPEDSPETPIVAKHSGEAANEIADDERPKFVPSAVVSLPLPPAPTVAAPPVIPPVVQQQPEVTAQPQPSGVGSAIEKVAGVASAAWTIAQWGGLIGATGGVGGLVMGGIALARTFRRITTTARAPPVVPVQPVATSNPQPVPQPIILDTPPPPQAVITENRFTPYERDTFAEAYAWAEREFAMKYPGSVALLETLRGFINQYLASKQVKKS